MTARLARYEEMRDFARTPEPRGAHTEAHLAPRYGIQMHAATRLHHDLRLEWDGVLLSWAVTRGPSLDPGEKRLAVRTEDHPLSYLTFEGVIPKGNYGAGTVMLWDIGHWEPLGAVDKALAKGHLRFRLHGARLTGDWHLIRMNSKNKRENWLLTKVDDDAAGAGDPVRRYRRSVATGRTLREIGSDRPRQESHAGPLPRVRKPQLATLDQDMVDGEEWWHEVKFDGYRALVALGQGGPRVFTRSGKDWTDRFDSLLPAFAPVDCEAAMIDGEIVAGAGLQGFSALQKAIKKGGPFRFYAFDCLSRNGEDLTGKPLDTRRDVLEDMWKPLPEAGPVQLSPIIRNNAQDAFDAICASGGEGLIAKRRDAPYLGRRTRSWRKIKCQRRDEFVILGWQESDKRNRPFASLALGAAEGDRWTYVGKVGTGFDADGMDELAQRMRRLQRSGKPVNVPARDARGVHWITPDLVAEVSYAERTDEGRLRHAVFHGLRDDKPARQIRLDNDMAENRISVAGIGISSADRRVFPKASFTKLDVARYYEKIADRMLPFTADRPLSLLRLPEGLSGERFFQKHAGRGFPDGIHTLPIAEADGKQQPYMYVRDAEGLVAAAQMGTIEFHVWGSRRDRLERPERMVFDLDPDEGLGFSAVKSAAIELKDGLSDLDLPCWPLLSGGKGIHVIVPLRRTAGWDTVGLFARLFAELMAARQPKRFTAQMSKASRSGRIFIDWLRNKRGATAIAPFSLRARPGAPVAVPVSWDELKTIRSAAAFDLDAALTRSTAAPDAVAAAGLTRSRIEKLEEFFE